MQFAYKSTIIVLRISAILISSGKDNFIQIRSNNNNRYHNARLPTQKLSYYGTLQDNNDVLRLS